QQDPAQVQRQDQDEVRREGGRLAAAGFEQHLAALVARWRIRDVDLRRCEHGCAGRCRDGPRTPVRGQCIVSEADAGGHAARRIVRGRWLATRYSAATTWEQARAWSIDTRVQ